MELEKEKKKRERKIPNTGNKARWSIKQRRRLHAILLKEYPIDAYKSIATRMGDKDEHEVKEFILKIKQKVKNKISAKGKNKDDIQRAPLEEWLEISTDLVENEPIDNSANLAKVMSVISTFEDFKTTHIEDYDEPDFKSIYKYMSQLLQSKREEDLIKMGPMESAIIVDMLHGLMEVLSGCDVTVQRNVMKWKYQLLRARDAGGHIMPECQRRASENDFTEFIEEARQVKEEAANFEKRYMERLARKSQGKEEAKGKKVSATPIPVPSKSTSRDMPTLTSESPMKTVSPNTLARRVTPFASMPKVMPFASRRKVSPVASMSKNATATPVSTQKKISEAPSTSGESQCIDLDAEEDCEPKEQEEKRTKTDQPERKRHKPGRKGAMDPPETPRTEIYLVMPPEGVKIVNFNPRSKIATKERQDGKYKALNQNEELINDDLSRDIFYDVHRTKYDKKKRKNATPDKSQVERSVDFSDSKYDKIVRSNTDGEVPVKKPKLYSLNPFCLPVSLLDLDGNKKS